MQRRRILAISSRSLSLRNKSANDRMISKSPGRAGTPSTGETPLVTTWKKFIREKQFIKNLSPATIYDYGCAWNKWNRWLPDDPAEITGAAGEEYVRDCIMGMRASGLSAVSTNSYLRVLKVFLHWLKVVGADGMPIKVQMLQAPRQDPRTFTPAEQSAL